MARTLHKLTSRQVETINKAGRYSDGGGLYLRITPIQAVFAADYIRNLKEEIAKGQKSRLEQGL